MSRGISLISPFLVMPELLRYLGNAYFGIWITAVSITSMGMFMDLGIGNGLLTTLSHSYGHGDFSTIRQNISTSYVILSLVAGIIFMTIGLLSLLFIGGVAESFKIIPDTESLKIIVTCLAAFAITLPISIVQRLMIACQKSSLCNFWQILTSILSVSFCLLAIYSQLQPWMVVTAYSFAPVFTLMIASLTFYKKHPEFAPAFSSISWQSAKSITRFGSHFFILSIITCVSLNADNIIINQHLGPEAVTEYSIPAKLASLIGLLITTTCVPLWAANGEALARNDLAWIRKMCLSLTVVAGLVATFIGFLLYFFGNTITEVWMGRRFADFNIIIIALAAFSIMQAIVSPSNMLLNSKSKIKIQIIAWSIFLIVTLTAKTLALNTFSNIWIIPAISAISYCLFIAPPVFFTARKICSQA